MLFGSGSGGRGGTVVPTSWKQQLEGTTSVLEPPTDRPRPAVKTFRGATIFSTFQGAERGMTSLSQRGRSHPVHDPLGGVSDIALSLYRAD